MGPVIPITTPGVPPECTSPPGEVDDLDTFVHATKVDRLSRLDIDVCRPNIWLKQCPDLRETLAKGCGSDDMPADSRAAGEG